MKATHCIFMACAMLLATGCSTDASDTPLDSKKKITLQTSITTGPVVTGQTRSPQLSEDGSGDFSSGDTFTLLTSTPSGAQTTFEYQVGTSELFWTDLQYTTDDHSVDFAACYPVQPLQNGQFSFDLEAAPDKDLLWAHMENVPMMTDMPVSLKFKHAMHRLVINYKMASGEQPEEPIQTVCTAKSTCVVDLASGTLEVGDSPTASFSATDNKAVFLLVPQNTSDVTLQISLGENIQEYRLDNLISGHDRLEGGMQLNINLKVKNGSISLEGSSIVGWGDQGTVDGEIIL